jgi:hypothetical protein
MSSTQDQPRYTNPQTAIIGQKGATLFCTYWLDKRKLRLCWWPSAKERRSTLDPEKQDPPRVLMVMERPKDSGPVLDARQQAAGPACVLRRLWRHAEGGPGKTKDRVSSL